MKLTRESFKTYLLKELRWDVQTPLLVGFSGGGDSTALLDLLHRSSCNVIAAHLNHGLRPEADAEQAVCEELCLERSIPLVIGKANVTKLARDRKMGIEEASREARYAFFRQTAHQTDCRFISIAHTRSDQVETILLNLTRGGGLAALSGMQVLDGDLFRPLLPFDHSDSIQYCKDQDLAFCHDSSNENLEYSRVRIRKQVIPELVKINSAFASSLSKFSEITHEEDEYLDAVTAHALQPLEIPLNSELRFLTIDSEAAFDLVGFSKLPLTLKRRAIRLTSIYLGATPTFDQTQLAIQYLDKAIYGIPSSVSLEGGKVVIELKSKAIHFRKIENKFDFAEQIPGAGVIEYPELNWKLEIGQIKATAPPDRQERNSLKLTIPSKSLDFPLHLRPIEPGDRIQPLGYSKKRKLSNLISEYQLTAGAKHRLPILFNRTGPIWIPGICVSNALLPQISKENQQENHSQESELYYVLSFSESSPKS